VRAIIKKNLGPNETVTAMAWCPAGKNLLGGGGTTTNPPGYPVSLVSNGPSPSATGSAWTVTWQADMLSDPPPSEYVAYAICGFAY
jgi:hypothetical protein